MKYLFYIISLLLPYTSARAFSWPEIPIVNPDGDTIMISLDKATCYLVDHNEIFLDYSPEAEWFYYS